MTGVCAVSDHGVDRCSGCVLERGCKYGWCSVDAVLFRDIVVVRTITELGGECVVSIVGGCGPVAT